MMKLAQLAHGEHNKYIFTNLKYKTTCTGHCHWLFFFFWRNSGFHFIPMVHLQFFHFSIRKRAEF